MSFMDFLRGKKKKPIAFSHPEPELEADPPRHCFVLCPAKTAATLDPEQVLHAVQIVFGVDYQGEAKEEGVVTVSQGETLIGILAHLPHPIPEQEAEHYADGNMLWPDGANQASKHSSHVIVTTIGGPERSPIDAAMTLTQLTLVALELFDGIGVYWGAGSVCNSREVFEEFCDDMSEDSLPVSVWIRFQLARGGDQGFGIYTLGMSQFGLMELEADQSPMEVRDLFAFLSNIASYLIKSGPVIADGNTVGGSEEERIVVRHKPSMVDPARRVYKLIFE